MSYGNLKQVSPSVLALQIPTKCLQNAQAPRLHLLDLPPEILNVVFQQMTDIDTLFASRQTCRRMYGIYDRNRARLNTGVTLTTLNKRGVELRRPCLFAEVILKDDRWPSIYLKPAVRDLYDGKSDLCQNSCRALLELRHFVGYDEDGSGRPGWRYRVVMDEEAILRHYHPGEPINYHLLILGQMSEQDVGIVKEMLWLQGV